MGTRHFQKVIDKQGQVKIAQYGQWDGYPSGQGVEILNFLKNADLKKYQNNLKSLRQATQEDYDKVNKLVNMVKAKELDWQEEDKLLKAIDIYYAVSRDCGSDLHKMVEEGKVEFLTYMEEDEASKWCEGLYTIDFQNNVFISEYYDNVQEYALDNLPSEEDYLSAMDKE